MIDLASEKLLTLSQAAKRLLVNTSTVFRWITQSFNGVRLEGIKLGSRWRTSEEALQRFGDRLTPNQEAVLPSFPSFRSPARKRRDDDKANERLDELLGVRKCETCRKVIVATRMVIPKNEKLWCPQCLVKRKSASIGQRIRTFRWTAMISQKALSDRTGIDIDSIRAYERNEKTPTDSHRAKLIEVFGPELVSGMAGESHDDQQ